MNEESLFIEVLEIRDPVERAAFLDRVCAGDAAVRNRLERLLARHERAGSFLERPAAPGGTVASPPLVEGTAAHHPASEAPGAVIGPYKLLQELGEGGMG